MRSTVPGGREVFVFNRKKIATFNAWSITFGGEKVDGL
jgi:hypothetical protein